MAIRRIYQIAKEFERDEKAIIEFLTGQGIKVGNRLSAVSEEAYEMLKTKFLAPPEPEPAPEPVKEPEPAPQPAPVVQPQPQAGQPQPQGGGKKKKKKNKTPQQIAVENAAEQIAIEPEKGVTDNANNVTVSLATYEGMVAGSQFIANYRFGISKKKLKATRPNLSAISDPSDITRDIKIDYPDGSPMRYWQAVDKLSTKSLKLLRAFGLDHRDTLGTLRTIMNPIGVPFEPRDIFTEEENLRFEEHRLLLYKTFGHGMGAVNDRLYELKRYAWDMRTKYEHMDFVEYAANPDNPLRCKERTTYAEMADALIVALRAVARRMYFYLDNKERVEAVVTNFLGWIDGYAKLKAQGADEAKLEKYLELEQKFIDLVIFASLDNLLEENKRFGVPYDNALALLLDYRDNLDDPDAERNFKYKVRGITNVIFKSKEYVFLFRFADLVPQVDYRPPEEIAAAEAAENADVDAKKESPAESET